MEIGPTKTGQFLAGEFPAFHHDFSMPRRHTEGSSKFSAWQLAVPGKLCQAKG
jgi:hypothetical protein